MATEVTVESGNVVTVGVVTSPTVLTTSVGSGVQGPAGPTGATGAQGPAGPTGATGATGPAGANGISITAANIVSGNLVLTFSNTVTLDVGNVVGPTGATGATGPTGPAGANGVDGSNGISVTSANVVSGNLVLTFSNSAVVDVGNVTGATGTTGPAGATGPTGATGPAGANGVDGSNGISITAANVVSGNLIITFSNTAVVDAGNVVGSTGATGATGPAGANGISITAANVTSGNLIITFSNSATADAGNVRAFASNADNITSGTLNTARLPATVNVTTAINVGNSTSNVAITSGNITLTGNLIGTSANVVLVAGSYTATFDNTGKLVLPSMGGEEGGEINFGIPAANTTLNTRVVLDVYRDRLRIFDGSTKGAYIDLSQAGTGVSTLLNNRVSGFVNAGTYVTMDNLKATVSTAGNRSLEVATVSGSFSAYVIGTYTLFAGGTAGIGASITVTTTPALAINWNFIGAGDTVIYIINDLTNSLCYRITMMIGNSYNNNMISIERLI